MSFAQVFTATQSNADARSFDVSAVAPRCTESRSFAAKDSQTVENDRENSLALFSELFSFRGPIWTTSETKHPAYFTRTVL